MKQASVLQKTDQLDPTAAAMEEVFEMAIINGAKAAGFDRLGRLEPGWRADIIGLTTDTTRGTPLYEVLSYLVFAARGEDVEFSMVDGEVLMENGTVTVADADSIRESASAVAESLDISAARAEAQDQKP